MRHFIRRLVVFTAVLMLALPVSAEKRAEHVFIVSLDGGKPAVIQQSKMPVLEQLVAEGAHTWVATTTFPSITLPSHTSMLTGVGPAKHKILWNDWVPGAGVVSVPTVFSEAKKAGLTTAMFVAKEKFRHLVQPGTVDKLEFNLGTSAEAAPAAAAYIVEKHPHVCFIHFNDADAAGHKFGWGSSEQTKAFADIDTALAVILKAIRETGLAGASVVIITADHGGHDTSHGTNSPDDMQIPWIVWGKGVKKHFTITAPVTTCDTAATALWLLDVPRPADLDGHPVTSAFE